MSSGMGPLGASTVAIMDRRKESKRPGDIAEIVDSYLGLLEQSHLKLHSLYLNIKQKGISPRQRGEYDFVTVLEGPSQGDDVSKATRCELDLSGLYQGDSCSFSVMSSGDLLETVRESLLREGYQLYTEK